MASRPTLALDVIRPVARQWVASALVSFDQSDPLVRSALETNFAWRRAGESERVTLLGVIANHFASIDGVLRDAERLFKVPTARELRRHFGESPPPAYAYDGCVYFTDLFRGFGPTCQTAMVVHESVHVFDARSGEPEIHISEWDEPKFSAIPPALQVHNASAYASYAAQVHHKKLAWPRDARFGAGRPNE